jgi:D-lactate dehydrogenase
MRVAVFSAMKIERTLLAELNAGPRHELVYFETLPSLGHGTSRRRLPSCQRICKRFSRGRCAQKSRSWRHQVVATRSTGFNHIDLAAAKEFGVKVVRVADYSPNSVAEFAVTLLLALNRNIPRAYNRTRDGNFDLDGLMGFDLVGRTVAVIGTGKIGIIFARIIGGFGCKLLGFDLHHSDDFEKIGGCYGDAEEIQAEADVISLHCPLTS